MRKTIKIFVAIFLIRSFSSCEDVIQIKLDEGNKLLVIDAFINDMRSPQKVRLTLTDSYFSGVNPPTVTGANVVLKDLSNGNIFNFIDIGNGDYNFNLSSTDTIGFVNHAYQLLVTYNGSIYTSTSTEHRSTTVDSIGIVYQKQTTFVKEGYACIMWAKDPSGPIPDYYWVRSYRSGVFFGKGIEMNIAVDGARGLGANGLLFTPPISHGITPRGEVFNSLEVVRAEIHSISLETFNFLDQTRSQTTNSGLFATTPENVKTNIITPNGASTKALGWFNVGAVGFMERVIP